MLVLELELVLELVLVLEPGREKEQEVGGQRRHAQQREYHTCVCQCKQ